MSEEEQNPLQGYFDWQVTTIMLAYDILDPLARNEEEAAEDRRKKIEEEVSQMTLAVVPDEFKYDTESPWPPEVMMLITRTTILRAAEIVEQGLAEGK